MGPRQLLPFVLSTLGVALFSLVIAAFRSAGVTSNLAIVYLLPILYAAVTWGWWPALLSAVLGFLGYNYFFTEPIHTFTMRDPEEWLALVIFLIVAAVTSNLAARKRARQEEAHQRASEAELLYDLGRSLSGSAAPEALREFAERLTSALELGGCAVVLDAGGGRTATLVSVGVAVADDAARTVLGRPVGKRRRLGRWIAVKGVGGVHGAPTLSIPLRVGERPIGALRLVGRKAFSVEETRVLATIADHLATALERERFREEAQKAEILRRTDELRRAVLSSVSHDLRTPLASIKASAGSLLADGLEWTDEDRRGFLLAIDRESDRLNRLVGNLLDMSRIEGGALRPRADWYDLGELAREVIARLRYPLRDREILLDSPDGLPPVEMDYLMIDQVLTNLIENAARYSPAGTPITVRIRGARDLIRACIIDRGPGIPVADQSRVFEKFARLESEGLGSGSGLGLAVSKGLVEAHGGQIWVEETPGGGATFCFALPAKAPPPPPPPDEVAGSCLELPPASPRARSGR